jgi:hypothetical protein
MSAVNTPTIPKYHKPLEFLVNLFKVNIMPKQKISLREKILQWTSKKDLYEIKSTREMFCKACGKLVS